MTVGVIVKTATRSGTTKAITAPGGTYFPIGQAERGRTDAAVQIRSMQDFVNNFGARVTYGALFDDLNTFFSEGGANAFVTRVVGPAATKGTLTLVDRAGSPLSTLRVDALGAGAGSANIKVEVVAGTSSGTYRVNLYDLTVSATTPLEIYNNLLTPANFATASANSLLVRATDLGSATAAPNNQPALISPTVLSTGTDDRASIVASNYTTAMTLLTADLGDGAVSVPGVGPSVHAALVAHVTANDRIALLTAARGETTSNLKSFAAAQNSEFSGLFAPWVTIPDDAGGSRSISPEGYVAAKRNLAAETEGPWRAPAGEIAEAQFVTGLDQVFDIPTANDLNDARVSVIRTVGGTTRLYGWRSLSTDENNYALLTGRDVLNRVVIASLAALEPFVFSSIDGRGVLFKRVEASLAGICEPMRQAGGLFENIDPNSNVILDKGYAVSCDATINTPTTLALNELIARVSIRVSPSAELIMLTVIKAGIGASL